MLLPLLMSVNVFAQSIIGDRSIADYISDTMAFQAGSGHVTPVDMTESPLGIGIGLISVSAPFEFIEVGIALATLDFGALQKTKINSLIGALPGATAGFYAEIAIPKWDFFLFNFFLFKNGEIGLRVAAVPRVEFDKFGISGHYESFMGGIELKSRLFKWKFLAMDWRNSFDFMSGSVGAGLDIIVWEGSIEDTWIGGTIGSRLVLSTIFNKINRAFIGVGVNGNLMSNTIKTKSEVDLLVVKIKDKDTSEGIAFPFDIRVQAGVQMNLFTLAVEYGILTSSIGVTFIPLTIIF